MKQLWSYLLLFKYVRTLCYFSWKILFYADNSVFMWETLDMIQNKLDKGAKRVCYSF